MLLCIPCWAQFCLTTIGLTQFIRPTGQISKWWNTIGCWLWGDAFTNSRLSIHSVQNGQVFSEQRIYAKMASNHLKCVRQHLAISMCWYAVWNYVFPYKADRKPKEWLSVSCNAMVRRVCFTWEHSQALEEVSLVWMWQAMSHVVIVLYYMHRLLHL